MGFEYTFVSATECYRSGRFNAMLLRMLERHEAVREVVLPSLGPERRETYSPILPVCPETGRVLQVPLLATDPAAGTITYRNEAGQGGRAAGHRRPGQAAVARRLGDALGGTRRRLRDVRQGPDRFGQDLEPDLPHSRRRAARGLLLRAVPRRARPEDFQVERQRPDGRGVADLWHQGKPEALHVPGAAQGQAALFRRHPTPRRRLLRAAGPLCRAGRGAALPQPGMAHP